MTEELKKAIEAAKTDEESLKAVAEKYKGEMKSLSEEELDSIAGGWSGIDGVGIKINIIYACECGNCGEINMFDAGAANRPCWNCGAQCPEYSRKR